MMSTMPQRDPHVRDAHFSSGHHVGRVSEVKADVTQPHSKSSKKKHRAPQPPSGLGQYKPRILSENDGGIVPVTSGGDSSTPLSGPNQSPAADPVVVNGNGNKPFLMGDKDTLVILAPPSDELDVELNVDDLALTSKGMPDEIENLGTDNPLFEFVEDAEESVYIPNGNTNVKDQQIEKTEGEELNGVFIPAPDYDEEEKTMEFPDEPEDGDAKKIFKVYNGEDFGQYFSDDESDPIDEQLRRKRFSELVDRKAKTEVKRPQYKKRETLLRKGKKDISRPSSLRNFSFADSKFGTLKESKKRHSFPSMLDKGEAELFVSTGSSYEHFLLRRRNSEEPTPEIYSGSTEVSSVSGYSRSDHKEKLWKKLTLRFKKQARNSSDLQSPQ